MAANKNNVVEEVPLVGNDVISPETVSRVVGGDEQALIEQLKRAKQFAYEQLELRKQAEKDGTDVTNMKSKEELEAEYRQKDAELNAAMINSSLTKNQLQNKEYHSQDNLNETQTSIGTYNISNNQVVTNTNKAIINPNPTVQTVTSFNQSSQQNLTSSNQAQMSQTTGVVQVPNKVNKKELKRLEKEKKIQEKNRMQEERRKVKEEKRKNSNFKYYMTILLFVGIFVMVYFLPNISNYVSEMKTLREQEKAEVITTGVLECTLKKYDKKFDYSYSNSFTFEDSKLRKLVSESIIKGDDNLDKEELDKFNSSCSLLKKETKSLDGIVVNCSLSNGVVNSQQELDYRNINIDNITTAYLEAGGFLPNYKFDQDINDIEKSMNAVGYTCKRYK